jgi:hypothetical protein
MITSRHRARPPGAVQADGEGADQVASGVSTVTTCRKDCTTSTGARSRAANGVLRRSAELTAKTKGQDREKRRPTAGRADGRSRRHGHKMSRASGSDRASRSSLVTTIVSPARQAASANRRPGRSRLVPVRP